MSDRAVVVSSDTHVGPRLEQLRPYCPARHLDAFDELAAAHARTRKALTDLLGQPASGVPPALDRMRRNGQTDGHHDVYARLRDLDYDGIAAEVIFAGSQNMEPIPWQRGFGSASPGDHELAAVGAHMYNEFLADFCSVEPHRHAGLAHIPAWDVEASVAEVVWAHAHGLRGVNFPSPRLDGPQYNDPVWEPFWSVCEDLGTPLTTHVGAGSPVTPSGPESMPPLQVENGSVWGRRAIHWMVFGGVFERHPGLTLVVTENPGAWWPYYVNEIDSVWQSFAQPDLREKCPRPPSEYLMRKVFVGASFLAPHEAEDALRNGYTSRLLWGSDYPHMEGTYQYPPGGDFDGEESRTKLALRFTFAGMPERETRAILGENAIDVYHLDAAALADVAARIGPTPEELAEPLAAIPRDGGHLSFRTFGPWS